MVTVLAPLAYVAFLVGSLVIFSKVYRRRQAVKGYREPWFPQHTTRDLYVSLLSMEKAPARPVLIAALIRRAMTDVQRLMEIRQAKMALQTLLQKGQIGDDTWNHLLETEKELEAELMEVVGEANTFKPGWGQIIFAHASDMVAHEKHQKIFHSIESEREKAAALYSKPAPAIVAPPIVGIAAGNPKKRVLPANLQNAQVPPSKPATPIPPTAGTPGRPLPAGQAPGTPSPAPAQAQSSAPVQAAPLTPAKAAVSGQAKDAPTPPRGTPPRMQSGAGSANSSGKTSPAKAPLMQRNDTAVSTASTTGTLEEGSSDDDDDDRASEAGLLNDATNTAGNGSVRKTPKKTPKKKKGKKK